MVKQVASVEAAADEENKKTDSSRRSELERSRREGQELVLSTKELAAIAVATRLVRRRYDQSEAPPVDHDLVDKCVKRELPERVCVEIWKLGLRWENWDAALLAADEKLIAAKVVKDVATDLP